jgi:hypothetical protein
LNDVKSYNTIKICYYNIMLATVKAQMLNEPYIHTIGVKIMNASVRIATGLTAL